jgi:serine/threonine protein kinase
MMHRDLKPKNVLVGPGGAKLADLGTAKMIGIAQRTAQHTVGPGTAIYHPREVLDGRYTDSVDVFSLGLTMEEIILCESPRREGAADPVHAEQHQRAVAAHPSMEGVIQRCIADHDARGSSAEVVEALAALAAAPGFLTGSLDGSHQEEEEEEESRSWMETVQRDALRELIDGVTRRRRALAWRRSAEAVERELLTARAEVERVTNQMQSAARQQMEPEPEPEPEPGPEPRGPPPTYTASLGRSFMRPTQSREVADTDGSAEPLQTIVLSGIEAKFGSRRMVRWDPTV